MLCEVILRKADRRLGNRNHARPNISTRGNFGHGGIFHFPQNLFGDVVSTIFSDVTSSIRCYAKSFSDRRIGDWEIATMHDQTFRPGVTLDMEAISTFHKTYGIWDPMLTDGSPHRGPVIRIHNVLFVINTTSCWTNSRRAGDLTRIDAHVTPLQWWTTTKTFNRGWLSETIQMCKQNAIWKYRVNSVLFCAGLILGLRPANERRRYFVTTSLIGWAQT